jgi:tetratricopeptide (TPR) repeat protein
LDRVCVPAVCGLLLLAVAVVFGQTVRHEFINLDDSQYVYENPHLTSGTSAEAVVWALTKSHNYNWCPLTWWSYMWDYRLCGLKPWGYHLTNVLLHAATAMLLFLVLRRMTGRLWPSAVVAALFAVHPLRAESVAWAAERKDCLSGVFFMLTLWAYTGYVRAEKGRRAGGVGPLSSAGQARAEKGANRGLTPTVGRRRCYLAVIVFFALGLMAKPMLVTLPFVLLLLDYWPLGRLAKKDGESGRGGEGEVSGRRFAAESPPPVRALHLLAEKLPLLAMAGGVCALTLWAQRDLVVPTASLSWYWRIGNVLVSYVAYLRQFFFPAGLALWYPLLTANLQTWKILSCFGLLAAVTAGALAGWRRYPYVLVGWLWYLGMLLPVIGLVQVTGQAMADRFTYLPEIGIAIALVWGACSSIRHTPCAVTGERHTECACYGPCWGVVSALALTILMACAWRQTSFWRDSNALWRRSLDCTSDNVEAHYCLGLAEDARGRADEALEHYRTAVAIRPDFAEGHNNLAVLLAKRGRIDEAEAHVQKALEDKPDYAEAHNNLAVALAARGRTDEAIAHYRKALELKPDYVDAHYNLAVALAARGQIDEAIGHYRKALEITPDYNEAHNNLAVALAARGRIDEALAHYQRALKLNPGCAEAHYNLAVTLAGQGRIDEALAHYQRAVHIKPDYAEAHNNLGIVLAGHGRIGEAMAQFQRALEVRPDYAEAHYNLAVALAGQGRIDEAIAHFRKASEIKPDYAEAHFNLAVALASRGRTDEAVVHFQQALVLAEQQNKTALVEALKTRLRIDEAGTPRPQPRPPSKH